MSKEQLVKRMLAMNSMVDSQKIRTGDLEDDDWDKLVGSVRKICNSNLVIDDTSCITSSELSSKCRKLKIEQGLDLVIIDYLQLMTGAGKRKSDSRQQEISVIRSMIQEYSLCFFIMMHIPRYKSSGRKTDAMHAFPCQMRII